MAKVRVYELAKEFGVESKVVMAKLQELGEFVRSASSTIEAPVVRKLKEAFSGAGTGNGAGSQSAAPAKKAAKKSATKRAEPAPPAPTVPAPGEAVEAPSPTVPQPGVPETPPADRPKPTSRPTARPTPPQRPSEGPPRPAPGPPTRRGPQQGARPAGPRPGNNPFTSGSTGMPRPQAPGAAGPRPPGPRPGPGAPRPNPSMMPSRPPTPRSGERGGERRQGPGGGRPAAPSPRPSGGGRTGGPSRGGGFGGGRGGGAAGPGLGSVGGRPAGGGRPGAPVGGRPGGRGGRGGTQGAFGRPGGRGPTRGRKSKKQRRQEFDNMQAPSVGGVQIPRGNGQPVRLPRGASLTDFAEKIGANPASLVQVLLHMGEMVTATQSVGDETLQLLGAELNYDVQVVSPEDEDRELLESFDLEFGEDEGGEDDLVPRPPVVTVMGHVDHGKTKLLDAIRSTEVAESEAGGITQHIGAYQVHVGERAITFIDTPGHEAFTAMRARGAQTTDIVVLVVAADDGVKPQTIEALNHAQAADVPIVVAVNKIDKEGADPQRVRGQLTEYGLVAEEFGGETMFVDISAKAGLHIEDLLESILLTADASLDLKANPRQNAQGVAIEAHLDRGRGAVASVLVQRGTLSVSDTIVVGEAHGRVRALLDENGKQVKEARPSRPVQVLGLTAVPSAGDSFLVVSEDRVARQIAERRQARERAAELAGRRRRTLEDWLKDLEKGKVQELNLILKGDMSGSVEALEDALLKIDVGEDVSLRVIHRGVGAISQYDVSLAVASDAVIIGYNVRPEGRAREMADREGVDVRYYSVIYQAIEEVERALKGMLKPEYEEVQLGTAEVREVFRVPRIGNVAGCMVRSGTINRGSKARLVRDGIVVADNLSVDSLKRFKDDVTEVRDGFECGVGLGSFNDIKVDDTIETFELREKPR